MKIHMLACILLGTLAARAQNAAPAATTPATSTPSATTVPAAPATTAAGMTIDGLVYPTNLTTLVTAKAGILGLRAGDIPRYTQTGPLPTPAPARPGVKPGGC